MMKTNYFDFFNSFRKITIKDDKDLIYQVGWSINNVALSDDFVGKVVEVIQSKLDLKQNDCILDFCCGNGLISYELSKNVALLIGIDFSKGYIENANIYKKNTNIEYIFGSVHDFDTLIDKKLLEKFWGSDIKILMSYSLGYFDMESFTLLLSKLNRYFEKFKFYITAIPDFNKYKKVFPNITSRIKFIFYDRVLKKTKGIGRFWMKNELKRIAQQFSLIYDFDNKLESIPGQEYRFNLLLEKKYNK